VSEIFIPAMGMAMEEATLVEWLKKPGDPVATGEVVALFETDKGVVELEAESSGVLGTHVHDAGAVLPVGTVIGEVVDA
jgi:pyruvate dehydrogenase E2 component (dihydrolipoamide acetyltransferase)